MAEFVQVDDKYFEDLQAIETRLDRCIEGSKSFVTLDSIIDNANTDVLEILMFIKTGKKK